MTTDAQKNAFVKRIWRERMHTASKEEFLEYVENPAFKDACREVIIRQAAGETFTFDQLAEAIGIPSYLLDMWVTTKLQQVAPSSGKVN
jgi:hypothetical protein